MMTAEALLCRMYLGWTKDYAALDQGVKYLVKSHFAESQSTELLLLVLRHASSASLRRFRMEAMECPHA